MDITNNNNNSSTTQLLNNVTVNHSRDTPTNTKQTQSLNYGSGVTPKQPILGVNNVNMSAINTYGSSTNTSSLNNTSNLSRGSFVLNGLGNHNGHLSNGMNNNILSNDNSLSVNSTLNDHQVNGSGSGNRMKVSWNASKNGAGPNSGSATPIEERPKGPNVGHVPLIKLNPNVLSRTNMNLNKQVMSTQVSGNNTLLSDTDPNESSARRPHARSHLALNLSEHKNQVNGMNGDKTDSRPSSRVLSDTDDMLNDSKDSDNNASKINGIAPKGTINLNGANKNSFRITSNRLVNNGNKVFVNTLRLNNNNNNISSNNNHFGNNNSNPSNYSRNVDSGS
jgi:hypothetical protein